MSVCVCREKEMAYVAYVRSGCVYVSVVVKKGCEGGSGCLCGL